MRSQYAPYSPETEVFFVIVKTLYEYKFYTSIAEFLSYKRRY